MQEKLRLKAEKEAADAKYKFAMVDGRKELVGHSVHCAVRWHDLNVAMLNNALVSPRAPEHEAIMAAAQCKEQYLVYLMHHYSTAT